MAIIGGVAAATLGYTGLGGSGGHRDRARVERETEATTTATPTGLAQYEKPEQIIESGGQYAVVLKTEAGGQEGEIRIELFADDAPEAVNSFVFLAQEGFYDDLLFFFVKQGFVAQAGDPTCDAAGEGSCTGTGGVGYTLPLEVNGQSHQEGAVVLPAIVEGEEVHGSQFRILLAGDTRLDGKETVFGRVVSGLDVLQNVTDAIPCFGQEPSDTNPCQELDPAMSLTITGVIIDRT